MFYPRCLPLKATYNHYGSLEDIEMNLNSEIILAQLQSDVITGRGALTKNHSLEEFIDLAAQNLLEVKNGYKKDSVYVGLYLVHEHVFQALVKTQSKTKNRDREFGAWLIDRANLFTEKHGTELFKLMMDAGIGGLRASLCPHSSDVRFYNQWLVDEILAGRVVTDTEEFKDFLKEVEEFQLFCRAMSEGRIGWMPQCGKGSQNDSLKVHKAIGKAVNAYKWAKEE